MFAHAPAGTGDNKGGHKDEVARLVETLALGSVGENTQKNYLAKWNTWVKERQAQGKEPWWHTLADPKKVLSDLLGFMASRCFVHNNRQSTVRGYVAAINFHEMFAGWELPMSHCMIAAVGKGIDRAHGMSKKKAQVGLPLSWSLLSQGRKKYGRQWACHVVGTRGVIFYAVQSVRAVGIRRWQSSPEFCLTRECLTFLREGVPVAFENRSTATALQIRFEASKCDQKRAGCTITRTRLSNEREMGGVLMGAFEVLLELLDVHPQLPGEAPLTARATSRDWKVFTRTEAVTALRLMVGYSGRDPMQFALHSGRIGGGHPVGGARYFGVANPARRKMKV